MQDNLSSQELQTLVPDAFVRSKVAEYLRRIAFSEMSILARNGSGTTTEQDKFVLGRVDAINQLSELLSEPYVEQAKPDKVRERRFDYE